MYLRLSLIDQYQTTTVSSRFGSKPWFLERTEINRSRSINLISHKMNELHVRVMGLFRLAEPPPEAASRRREDRQDPHFGVPGGVIEAVRMRFHMHLHLLIAMRGDE
jgi:hypothetical protein